MEFSDDDSRFPARSSRSKASVLTSLTLFLRKVESSAHFTYAINVYNAVCTRCTIQGALYCWHLVDINSHIKSGSLSSMTIALEKERRKERPCWTAALKGQFYFSISLQILLLQFKYCDQWYWNENFFKLSCLDYCNSHVLCISQFSLAYPSSVDPECMEVCILWRLQYKTVWYLYTCWKSNLFT